MDSRKVVVKAKKVIATRIRCIVNGRSIMVSVSRDISSLEEAGYITTKKVGRQQYYFFSKYKTTSKIFI